jgi:hypothetical protein
MESTAALNKLLSTKSTDRRRAAKEIGKRRLQDLGGALFQAYCNERHSRTWETKMEMIISLGLLVYKPAISPIEAIVQANESHDALTYAAAQTYVRLKRTSLHDA